MELRWHLSGQFRLELGDKIRTADGSSGIVLAVVNVVQSRVMFNLEVQGNHDFFVGGSSWLVHNCKVTESTIREAMKGASLVTQQGGVSLPKIQQLVDGVRSGTIKWDDLPHIKVDNGIIVDGNHRYVTSRILGLEVKIQPYPGGRPSAVVSWDDVRIDPKDWGR